MNLAGIPPVLWLALVAAAVAVVVLPVLRRQRLAKQLETLRAEWGRARERTRDLAAIASLYRHQRDSEGPDRSLDDRTWADLNLDEIFTLIDRTHSVIGQQVLYARLRSAPAGAHRDAFEALVTTFTDDARARERAQVALARLSGSAGYDLWRLTEPGALQRKAWHALMPAFALVMLAAVIAAIFVTPAAWLVIVAGTVVSFVVRATAARELAVVSGAFTQVAPLLSAARDIALLSNDMTAPILGRLSADVTRLARLGQIARWVSRDATNTIVNQLLGLALEYVNLLLCLDANALFFGARELDAHGRELLSAVVSIGDADAALSVASYRAGTPGWLKPALLDAGAPTVLRGLRHPLLPDAVPNDLAIDNLRGAIITGSNMSGKTTFLRTVGVNVVLAQTINTCLADGYRSPLFAVRSCIGLADDPASGRSYYMVEVDSVLSLVHCARLPAAHLFLFDELFRGTNAVERIAAGEAVLRSLVAGNSGGGRHAVLAATHDQELVDMLGGLYASYHFTDTVDGEGMAFDYRLKAGTAVTRNAILLLRLRGAPESLVTEALARAADLDRTRQHS